MRGTPRETRIVLEGAGENYGKGVAISMGSPNPLDENSHKNQGRIALAESSLENVGTNFTHLFPPYSVNIPRLKK